MPHKLDLRSNIRSGDGSDSLNWTDVGFIVTGLPPGFDIRIGPRQGGGWSVLRVVDGLQGEWEGDYESPLAALDSIQRSFEPDSSL